MKSLLLTLAVAPLFLAAPARAQWQDVSYTFKSGWNAVYLHGDASYTTLATLFASYPEVTEVWRWNPNPTQVQFTDSPQIPSAGTPEWSTWKRDGSVTSLSQMVGQSAYLVKCSSASPSARAIRQRAMPPSATWVRSGANLLGFPGFGTGASSPTFSSYFATFPAAIASNVKIYKYVGGDLGPGNPLQVFSTSSEKLDRTQAYWFQSAVVGNFWTFLYQPQIGLVNYVVELVTGTPASSFSMLGPGGLAKWSIILVDTWMWTPFVMLICLAGLRSIPDYIYEAAEIDRASKWRQFWTITVPMVLPFLMLAVLFRGIENFKMFDMVVLLTGGGPGNETLLASIDLKREAFEKWRTGYSSAYAIILFVTVFGLASIYVKALNKVKER
jgi:hypothetical protein